MPSIWQAGTSHSRRAGLACLLLALVLLGLFQAQVAGRTAMVSLNAGTRSVEMQSFRGYEAWKEMPGRFANPRPMGEAVVASCLATGTLLVFAGPFLLGSLLRSRVLWQLVFASSALVAAGITGLVMWHRLTDGVSPLPWDNPTAAVPLLWFPVLHLGGMLFLRPAKSTASR